MSQTPDDAAPDPVLDPAPEPVLAASPDPGPEPGPHPARPRVVVAAAILSDGRLLAARRTSPPATAGRWELPGGKVDPGETDEVALVREIDEELGVRIVVETWLPGETSLSDAPMRTGDPGPPVLRVARARIVTGEPHPREHDRLRWLAPAEFDDVDWLDGDRPFVTRLADQLAQSGSSGRPGLSD